MHFATAPRRNKPAPATVLLQPRSLKQPLSCRARTQDEGKLERARSSTIFGASSDQNLAEIEAEAMELYLQEFDDSGEDSEASSHPTNDD